LQLCSLANKFYKRYGWGNFCCDADEDAILYLIQWSTIRIGQGLPEM
jgi:hypothetical protein